MMGKVRAAALLVAVGATMAIAAPTNVGPAWAAAKGGQLVELAASGSTAWDWFGASVAVSGRTIVAGAPAAPLLASGVGRAYVFTETATGWRQRAALKAPDTVGPDWFGDAVAVSGRTIVVGAPAISSLSSGLGRAYVFTETATGWHQTAQLESASGAVGDSFGASVAVSGRTIVVGAPSHASKAGAAYVFTNSGRGWQATGLKGSDTVAKDDFGDAVGVSGTTIVVGAFGHKSEAGRAYVFTKDGGGWRQSAELAGLGTVAGDAFGDSVAVGGRVIAVGAGLAAADTGRVFLFTQEATGWREIAKLQGSDPVAKDDFGDAVAVSGNSVVVGTFAQGSSAGRAYLFAKTAAGWRQSAVLTSGSSTAAANQFGYSVAISGTTIAVGAKGQSSGAGRAYAYKT
jgi:FG-GAP repeat